MVVGSGVWICVCVFLYTAVILRDVALLLHGELHGLWDGAH